jgi:hypothetical protein
VRVLLGACPPSTDVQVLCEAPIQHWVRTRFVRSQQLCLVLTTPCPPPPTPPPTTHTLTLHINDDG